MRKFCFVMIALAALVVAGSSNSAFAANATSGQSIVSPYWQADANSIYTFIGITNPSVSGATSRAVTVTAVQSDSSSSTSSLQGTITIDPGRTARFFIANTNHSSVNSSLVSGANWITTTGRGHVVIEAQYPYAFANSITDRSYAGNLSVWGAVIIPSTATGFAMEFIGDMTDSEGITGVTVGDDTGNL